MQNFKSCIYLLFCGICFLNISCEKESLDSKALNEEAFYEYSRIELEVFNLLNEHRRSINLKELKMSNLSSNLAMNHNHYMIEESQISHDNFTIRLETLLVKENATSVGENVAFGQISAQAVIDAWLNSSGHKENIEGDYTDVGISVRKDSNGINYFAQLFYKK